MTEVTRQIQLAYRIKLVPALFGTSNMNAYISFIQNSSLVDKHERAAYLYIDNHSIKCNIRIN